MTDLATINKALEAAGIDPGDLTQIIADVKSAVRASDAAIIADLTSQIELLPAITAERDKCMATIVDFLKSDPAAQAEMVANALKTEAQKRTDALKADYDAAVKAAEDAKAALDAAQIF